SACQYIPKDEKAAEDYGLTDTLAYEYQHYIRYSEHIVKTAETTDTAFYTVSYPSFKDSTVNRFVLTALLGNDTATIIGTAQTFINEYDRFFLSDPFPRIWTS